MLNSTEKKNRRSQIVFSFICLILFLSISLQSMAQKSGDDVLMTIDGDEVTKSEFLNIYNKNNTRGDENESVEEYLELFINFKLKVREAQELGYDTTEAFVNELAGYRKQLAQPYLTDKNMMGKLMEEAYERMKYDIRFSHLLVKLERNASPEDTLKAYDKIMKIRNRIENGEDFNTLAEALSDDISARDTVVNGREYKGNHGELGYFTVFNIPFYDFETAAYNTPEGEVSMPVRTSLGYHLLKVHEKRQALGKFQAGYILLILRNDSKAEDSLKKEKLINDLYARLQQGEKFEELAKEYSEDKGSAAKGGILPWYGVNKLVPEFVEQIYNLSGKGSISKPFLTRFGWNIVKLVDTREIGTYDEMKGEIKQSLNKDRRTQKSKVRFINQLKNEYKFSLDEKALDQLIAVVDTTIFQRGWKLEKAAGLNDMLLRINDKIFSQQDFAAHLHERQTNRTPEEIDVFVNRVLEAWIEKKLIEHEDSKLEEKYPEFKALMKEYHDGILLFNLMQDKIWTRAVKDTTGLKAFYDENKENYLWDDRLLLVKYSCATDGIAKEIREKVNRSTSVTDTEKLLEEYNADTTDMKLGPDLIITGGKYEHGANEYVDRLTWEKGLTDIKEIEGRYVFSWVDGVVKPEMKTLEEARGPITSDYQDSLEKEWINELREKYTVVINKKVLKSIK